jgi:hypothetical protein
MRALSRRSVLILIGTVLTGAGVWLVTSSVYTCLSQPYLSIGLGSQCPAAYVGLTVFVLFTVGLTALVIGLSR